MQNLVYLALPRVFIDFEGGHSIRFRLHVYVIRKQYVMFSIVCLSCYYLDSLYF